jgi:replicative DNA helicase
LRDSGSIEQDANVVLLIHREAEGKQNCDNPFDADVIVAKNRNGATGFFKMIYIPELTAFRNAEFIHNDR